MAKRIPIEGWTATAVHRRWAWFFYACFVGLLGTAALVLLIWMVRPRPAVHPLYLIGSDVDGLVWIELSRASPRVERFLQTLIRPMSYEVQSRPEDLEQEVSRLLGVMTYRCAIGLLRCDPAANREQWAVVVPLKRMGDPLKVLVRQLAAREGGPKIEMETSGGVLRFWGKPDMPCFAIERRAFVAAGDRQWLNEVVARIERPLSKTATANLLYYGLPKGGKHCVARACILAPPKRWTYWAGRAENAPPLFEPIRRVRRFLGECGAEPTTVALLTAAVVVQPRGHLQCDWRVVCSDASAASALGRRMSRDWPHLSALLKGTDVAAVVDPTTTTTAVSFGWTTPPVAELLGLSPAAPPNAFSR